MNNFIDTYGFDPLLEAIIDNLSLWKSKRYKGRNCNCIYCGDEYKQFFGSRFYESVCMRTTHKIGRNFIPKPSSIFNLWIKNNIISKGPPIDKKHTDYKWSYNIHYINDFSIVYSSIFDLIEDMIDVNKITEQASSLSKMNFKWAPSKITHVAIKYKGITYSLPEPNRHHNVLWMIIEKTGAKRVDSKESEQGFLDTKGNFLTRKQALPIAQLNNQMNGPQKQVYANRLFSENLW